MEQIKVAHKAEKIRITMAEIKKLPVEMQHEIKGAISVLKIQKANQATKCPQNSGEEIGG